MATEDRMRYTSKDVKISEADKNHYDRNPYILKYTLEAIAELLDKTKELERRVNKLEESEYRGRII
jgi:hypothetical protein